MLNIVIGIQGITVCTMERFIYYISYEFLNIIMFCLTQILYVILLSNSINCNCSCKILPFFLATSVKLTDNVVLIITTVDVFPTTPREYYAKVVQRGRGYRVVS